MPNAPKDPTTAVREIMTAIAKGTRKFPGDRFFRGLHQQLHDYKPSLHDDFLGWLKGAGIKGVPTAAQTKVAVKLAKNKALGTVRPHGGMRDSY